MELLLDTHTLLWWLAGDARLSRKARSAIADDRNTVHVSAASAWEVSTKHRLGRLPDAGPMATAFAEQVAAQGFVALDITLDHGQRAGSLPRKRMALRHYEICRATPGQLLPGRATK